jgi:hypothetical protein
MTRNCMLMRFRKRCVIIERENRLLLRRIQPARLRRARRPWPAKGSNGLQTVRKGTSPRIGSGEPMLSWP